jgi:cobalt transporter subunit CbtA
MPAADLMARQTWWLGTAVATAAGIGLLIFTRQLVLAVVAVLLLVAPHVIGAPHPADLSSPIPEALHHLFVIRVTVVNFVVWAVLGGLAGALAPRWLVRNDDGLQALTAKSH